jgi:hypothetical protein
MSEIKLVYEPGNVEKGPENEGLRQEEMDRLLQRIKEAGLEYSVVDTSGASRQELEDMYTQLAVTPSVRKRYGVKRIFGTNKYPGSHFGRGVPALVVLENGRPVDVYPHEEKGGKIMTIRDYIDTLKRGARGRELAARMDALREKIGRVDRTARELIDEGRRR